MFSGLKNSGIGIVPAWMLTKVVHGLLVPGDHTQQLLHLGRRG